jgi:hypothetical protein
MCLKCHICHKQFLSIAPTTPCSSNHKCEICPNSRTFVNAHALTLQDAIKNILLIYHRLKNVTVVKKELLTLNLLFLYLKEFLYSDGSLGAAESAGPYHT